MILHGFCTAAIAAETIIDSRFAGDVDALRGMHGRFTLPLRLPRTVQVFTGDVGADGVLPLHVGTAPGGPAFLVGGFHG